MNLKPIEPYGAAKWTVIGECAGCDYLGRMRCYDADGKPFESYYCDKCAERIAAHAKSTPA